MLFKDRVDAGKKLAQELTHYRNKPNTLVIGLPRGGVPVAFEVAQALNLPMDIVVPRKIGAPMQPELALGAVTQEGALVLNKKLMRMHDISLEELQPIIEEEKEEAQRRLSLYRPGRGLLNVKNKTILLVDDGIATGATIRAAIESLKLARAGRIVVAIPTAPMDTVNDLDWEVDELVCLTTPTFFGGVGQVYENFGQTQDEEVIALMEKSRTQ